MVPLSPSLLRCATPLVRSLVARNHGMVSAASMRCGDSVAQEKATTYHGGQWIQQLRSGQRRSLSVLSSGRFSRLLDLGGAPSSQNDARPTKLLNLNKNCHLQAVIFDFGLLIQAMQHAADEQPSSPSRTAVQPVVDSLLAPASPDVAKIHEVANLLKVDVTGKYPASADQTIIENDRQWKDEDDDLSLILGETKGVSLPSLSDRAKQEPSNSVSPGDGIRSKYAEKLRKVTGSDIRVTNDSSSSSHKNSSSNDGGAKTKGDAEFLALARARSTAMESTLSSSSSGSHQWMAGSGTGQLLSYLNVRSMKLGLAAAPVKAAAPSDAPPPPSLEASQMSDFAKQLKDRIHFDVVVSEQCQAPQLIATTLARLQGTATSTVASDNHDQTLTPPTTMVPIAPQRCLWVSDRDDCLRAAKEAGLLTARIVRPNARRGNVSAHYTVETVAEIMSVVNEINGISFNAVLLGH
jgi:hypothetical protein